MENRRTVCDGRVANRARSGVWGHFLKAPGPAGALQAPRRLEIGRRPSPTEPRSRVWYVAGAWLGRVSGVPRLRLRSAWGEGVSGAQAVACLGRVRDALGVFGACLGRVWGLSGACPGRRGCVWGVTGASLVRLGRLGRRRGARSLKHSSIYRLSHLHKGRPVWGVLGPGRRGDRACSRRTRSAYKDQRTKITRQRAPYTSAA